MAWFNGVGYVSWESVWGQWNGITPRDGEAIRRVGVMSRWWGNSTLSTAGAPAGGSFLHSPMWEPHAAGPQQYGVYASRWPVPALNATLWTVVNRAGKNLSGVQLHIAARQGQGQGQGQNRSFFYDCYHGVALTPTAVPAPAAGGAGGSGAALSFELERGGFGCVVELDHNATADSDPAFTAYLGSMRGTTQRKLASYSDRWVYSQKIMVNAGERTSLAEPRPTPPAGGPLVFVPRGRFWFNVSGVQIEGRDALGADVQYVQSRKSTKLARTNQ
jgi:hypothetical protein